MIVDIGLDVPQSDAFIFCWFCCISISPSHSNNANKSVSSVLLLLLGASEMVETAPLTPKTTKTTFYCSSANSMVEVLPILLVMPLRIRCFREETVIFNFRQRKRARLSEREHR